MRAARRSLHLRCLGQRILVLSGHVVHQEETEAIDRRLARVAGAGFGQQWQALGYTPRRSLDAAVEELTAISGQKPVKTLAKKAIAGFKIRKGLPIGCKVTLRKARMYEFLDRLINFALPRILDFRGVNPKSFDGNGN